MRRMDFACGNVHAIADAVGGALTVYGQRHFPAENHMSGFGGMGVIGIVGVRAILPNVGVAKTLTMELVFNCTDIHMVPLAIGYGARTPALSAMHPERASFAAGEIRLGTSLGGEI